MKRAIPAVLAALLLVPASASATTQWFYNRQPIKAMVFLALGIVLSWLVSRAAPTDADALTRPAAALIVPLCALLAVSLWSVIDAWRTAAR